MAEKPFKLTILVALMLACFLFSLHSGQAPLTWANIWNFFFGSGLAIEDSHVLSILRIPRTVAAFTVGASLGAAGLCLQTLLKNPLAEPYTLGLSGGSSLGAVVAL